MKKDIHDEAAVRANRAIEMADFISEYLNKTDESLIDCILALSHVAGRAIFAAQNEEKALKLFYGGIEAVIKDCHRNTAMKEAKKATMQ